MGVEQRQLTGAELALDPAAVRGAIADLEQGPWAGLVEQDTEAKIARLVEDLARLDELEARHVDWDCYAQGYASAVPIVMSRRDDDAEAFRASSRFGDFEGVVVAVCRLAPLACVSSPGGERIGEAGMLGQGDFLDDGHVQWAAALGLIDATLTRHRIVRLTPEVLDQRIDPSLVIDTNFGDPPFTIFDAWFHWYD